MILLIWFSLKYYGKILTLPTLMIFYEPSEVVVIIISNNSEMYILGLNHLHVYRLQLICIIR